jgi:hypothetical protein
MSPTSESIKKGFLKEFVLKNEIETNIIIISYDSISENKMTLNNMLNVFGLIEDLSEGRNKY